MLYRLCYKYIITGKYLDISLLSVSVINIPFFILKYHISKLTTTQKIYKNKYKFPAYIIEIIIFYTTIRNTIFTEKFVLYVA